MHYHSGAVIHMTLEDRLLSQQKPFTRMAKHKSFMCFLVAPQGYFRKTYFQPCLL